MQTINSLIWDCGCGYATTAIFLSLNGYSVEGNTLEFYYDEIPARLAYWSKYGDVSKLKITYENHFDIISNKKYDYIIAQDTLHHLEPINDALSIISNSLKPHGKLIAIEENGMSFINRFKNYIRRGNKLIIELHDEKLNRTILLGNENLRPIKTWEKLLSENAIVIDDSSVEYIRMFTPFFYKILSVSKIEKLEKSLWKKNSLLRNYFYFGMNFIGVKR